MKLDTDNVKAKTGCPICNASIEFSYPRWGEGTIVPCHRCGSIFGARWIGEWTHRALVREDINIKEWPRKKNDDPQP